MAKKSKQTQACQSWKSRECLAGAKAEQAGDRWTKNPSVPFFVRKKKPVYFSRNSFYTGWSAYISGCSAGLCSSCTDWKKSMSNGGEEGCKNVKRGQRCFLRRPWWHFCLPDADRTRWRRRIQAARTTDLIAGFRISFLFWSCRFLRRSREHRRRKESRMIRDRDKIREKFLSGAVRNGKLPQILWKRYARDKGEEYIRWESL